MVLLLSVVGLVTSAFFFVSRDVAGTIVFHNFLGTFGVVQALSAANALSTLERQQLPLIVTALIAAGFLAAGYRVLHHASHAGGGR
jgi:predicted acyltransferase